MATKRDEQAKELARLVLQLRERAQTIDGQRTLLASVPKGWLAGLQELARQLLNEPD